jgi:diaminohydroxyphosphoribosylaminopyrimidine deaminase/5-amino-6-(5-phosphoribosylamino)uracil reductase
LTDFEYMTWALRLAESARGATSPNPMVGCVIVKEGQIVGQGAHLRAGGPHAEVHALRMAGEEAKGATMYVTLEPCSHTGRTPPCADAVVHAGIARLVVAMLDPNPRVSGQGVERVRAAGIQVDVGVCEEEARQLNEVFVKFITTRRPFVTLKAAMTLDGKIATHTGDSRWITGEAARAFVHRLRGEHDAILVGVGTVLADNPRLTARGEGAGKSPLRIILDSRLRTPLSAHVFQDVHRVPTWIVCGPAAPRDKRHRLEEQGVTVLELPNPAGGKLPLGKLLDLLGEREVTSLLVEGGANVNGSFLDEHRIDKIVMFVAPKLVGGLAPTPFAGHGASRMGEAVPLRGVTVQSFENDVCITGYPVFTGSPDSERKSG